MAMRELNPYVRCIQLPHMPCGDQCLDQSDTTFVLLAPIQGMQGSCTSNAHIDEDYL